MADNESIRREIAAKFEDDKEYVRRLGQLAITTSLISLSSKRQTICSMQDLEQQFGEQMDRDGNNSLTSAPSSSSSLSSSTHNQHHPLHQQQHSLLIHHHQLPVHHQRSYSTIDRTIDIAKIINKNNINKDQSQQQLQLTNCEHHNHQTQTQQMNLSSSSSSSSTLRKQESLNEKHRNSMIEAGTSETIANFLKFDDSSNIISGAETIKRYYQNTVKKYETLKSDYESLHKRYADLLSSHSAAVSKLDLAQEELLRCRLTYDEVVEERNTAVRECTGLKQQCTAAIRQWDKALRECNEAKEQLAKVQQQRDEAMKEINQAMTVRIKATKDLARLTEERNAAVNEYSLIMSERDSVHKEIEKLQEELTEAQKRVKVLEDEKRLLTEENDTLKKERNNALSSKEKLTKDWNYYREKQMNDVNGGGNTNVYDDPSSPTSPLRQTAVTHNRWGSSSSGVSSSWAQGMFKSNVSDLAKQNHLSASNSSSMSTLSQHKGSITNLEQANLEIDSLRKQVKQLQQDLESAQQEADVCRRRHDWAFSERDKIVLERESIRALCDRYRRERDRAVSDLAEALMDSDEVKRQRNETSKELKDLKDKYESQYGKESSTTSLSTTPTTPSSTITQRSTSSRLQQPQTQSLSRSTGKKMKEVLSNNSSSLFSSLSPTHESTQSTPAPTLLDRAYNEIFGPRNHQNKSSNKSQAKQNSLKGSDLDQQSNSTNSIMKNSKTINNLQMIQQKSESIDYSVVSAQTRDKNVFDYYKNRTGKAQPRVVNQVSSLISDSCGVGVSGNSPMPLSYTVEWLSPPHGVLDPRDHKLKSGDIRSVYIEKGSEPLGIKISCDTSGAGGIFVSSVSENSLAAQAGLQIGDQLLEVCGINMRNANYTSAANVLRQCKDSIRMLVQFNPDKFSNQVLESSNYSSFYGLKLNRKDNQSEPIYNAQKEF